MSVLYIALPIAVGLGALAMWACIRCIQSGQFEDMQSPAVRMLIDDQPQPSDDVDGIGQTAAESDQSTVD